MKFREVILKTGTKIILGKDAESNDELMKMFKGKDNIIFHTVAPGSPFCVIDNLEPSEEDIKEAATICASKSQDWRNHHKDIKMHQFTGKEIKKPLFAKTGTWKITITPIVIVAKAKDIQKALLRYKNLAGLAYL